MSLSAVLMGLEEGPAETLGHYWPAAMYSALEIGSGLTQVGYCSRNVDLIILSLHIFVIIVSEVKLRMSNLGELG